MKYLALLLAGSAVFLAACGGDDSAPCEGAGCAMDGGSADAQLPLDAADRDSGPVAGDSGPIGVDAGPCEADPGITWGAPITAPPLEWTFIPFPDSRCMNNTPTGIGVNINPDASDVLIYLEGGGACFNFSTCLAVAHSDGFDASSLAAVAASYAGRGIFNRTDPDNPLADWSYVFIPYCTGDVHAGNNPDGYLHRVQVGYANIGEYLERIVPTFRDHTRVLLTGSSAGGFGAALNYDRVQRAFQCTPVTLLDDAGPPMSDEYMKPCLQQLWRDLWALDTTLPADCAACRGADGGGLVNLAPYIAAKYPDRRFGLLSTTADGVIRSFFGFGYSASCNSPASMPSADFTAGLLDLRDTTIAPYDNFFTFYQDGTSHTFLGQTPSRITVGGTTLAEWIRRLVDDDPALAHVGP